MSTIGVEGTERCRQFFNAVEGGPLDLPYARTKGAAMVAESFEDVSFRLALSRKDGDLLLAAVADAGLEFQFWWPWWGVFATPGRPGTGTRIWPRPTRWGLTRAANPGEVPDGRGVRA
jgi:hypothetical protein